MSGYAGGTTPNDALRTDLSPHGVEPVHEMTEARKKLFSNPNMRPADCGRHGDVNAVGGNAKAQTQPIPALPNFQDQPAGPHRQVRESEEFERDAFGAGDNDWDDVTGR